MSVLKKYFDKSVNQSSPVKPDYDRVVNYDESGNEIITWVETDYPSLQAANGLVDDWSLTNLLKAGINPDFPIHTGLVSRLEGVGIVNDAVAKLDSILSEEAPIEESNK